MEIRTTEDIQSWAETLESEEYSKKWVSVESLKMSLLGRCYCERKEGTLVSQSSKEEPVCVYCHINKLISANEVQK